MRTVATQLRRYPQLYDLACQTYSWLQPIHLKEMLLGAKVQERAWQSRHLRGGNAWNYTNLPKDNEWVIGYWESRNHPHRSFLADTISLYHPTSVLEVGCNCGPNLYQLAKRLPQAQLVGVDINVAAVDAGNQFLLRAGITNAKLTAAKARDLSILPSGYYDIVFTDAVLIYVGPRDIEETVKQMLRIASKVVVVLERFREGNMRGTYRYGCWERDYPKLFAKLAPSCKMVSTSITRQIWDEERWVESGLLLEVRK